LIKAQAMEIYSSSSASLIFDFGFVMWLAVLSKVSY
jgi:hypothetical protein